MSIECPLCTDSSGLITSLLHLHSHCINAHPNEFHTCPWCTIPFGTIRALKNHAKNCSAFDRNQQREGEIFPVLVNGSQCWVCLGTFPSQEAAMHHYKEQHLYFSYICIECQQYFQRKSSLDDHHATCHAKAIKITTVSSLAANTPATPDAPDMSTARTTVIPVKIKPLNIVKSVQKRSALIANENQGPDETAAVSAAKKRKIISNDVSAGVKRYFMQYFNEQRCVDCEKTFPNTHEIRKHFEVEHNIDVLICSLCSKGYLSGEALKAHRQQCTQTDANYRPIAPRSAKKNLKVRADASMADKRFFMASFNQNHCVECDENFESEKAIAMHFRTKHHIEVTLCIICNKGYMSRTALLKHFDVQHKGEGMESGPIKAKSLEGYDDAAQPSPMIKIKTEYIKTEYLDSTDICDLTLDDD